MIRVLILTLVAFLTIGCIPEKPAGPSDEEPEEESSVTGDEPMEVTLNVQMGSGSHFPRAVKATFTGTIGTTFEVKVNGTLMESGTMPVVGMREGGPFAGFEGTRNQRIAYVVLPQDGTNTVSVSVIRGSEVAEDSVDVEVVGTCSENLQVYADEGHNTRFNDCEGCHAPEPSNASFDTLKTWDKVQNTSDPFVVANAPANADLTPGLRMENRDTPGGEYNHSDGQKWGQDTSTHFRVLELVYRMRTDFVCP